MKINFLNHASVLFDFGTVKLLTDPWYEGTCFKDGWGLRDVNPHAYANAAEATHLWVSHFHGDHFHLDTLKKLFELNPNISILTNDDFNFNMSSAFRRIGFKNIVSLKSRTPTEIGPGLSVTRFPCTGIDNFMLIKAGSTTILNYNDCNIPLFALRQLLGRLPSIDILLCNFNHAGKIREFPLPDAANIKMKLLKDFAELVTTVSPRHVLPFASHHKYIDPHGANQNPSMLVTAELSASGSNVVPWQIGDSCVFDSDTRELKRLPSDRPAHTAAASMPTATAPMQPGNSSKAEEMSALANLATKYLRRMTRNFFALNALATNLRIFVEDMNQTLVLNGRRATALAGNANADISAQSQYIAIWFSDIYGTDHFDVGAHYTILKPEAVKPLNRMVLMGLLLDNKLSLLQLLKMVVSWTGWLFFWNRREEILSVLLTLRFIPGRRA